MGDEKESFMKKFEITETKEGYYRSSKRLTKQTPETIIQPIMAFKLKASLELIR
jgi:hypothetical protein